MYKTVEQRGDPPTLPPGQEPDGSKTDTEPNWVLHDPMMVARFLLVRQLVLPWPL
jgi:hypothetical protein